MIRRLTLFVLAICLVTHLEATRISKLNKKYPNNCVAATEKACQKLKMREAKNHNKAEQKWRKKSSPNKKIKKFDRLIKNK